MPYIKDREAKVHRLLGHHGAAARLRLPGRRHLRHERRAHGVRHARQARRRRLDNQRRKGGLGIERDNRHARDGALRRRPLEGMPGSAIAIGPAEPPRRVQGQAAQQDGQRALNQGEIFFDNVRIPSDYVLVAPELYPLAGDMILATANGGMGACFTGLARAAYEEAMGYCKQRVQGGKLLCEHQLVQRKLFDMFIKVESARQLSRAVAVYNATRCRRYRGWASPRRCTARKSPSRSRATPSSSSAAWGCPRTAGGEAVPRCPRRDDRGRRQRHAGAGRRAPAHRQLRRLEEVGHKLEESQRRQPLVLFQLLEGCEAISPFISPTTWPALPSMSACTAQMPSRDASRRSRAEGVPPRWTWPSTVTR